MATTPAPGGGSSVGDTIVSIAQQLGVDPVLALAQAWIESGLNPQAKGDYGIIVNGSFKSETAGTPGGSYTSFGLYQLHEGGELGNLTEQQAFNPITNATVALTHVAAVAKQNPSASPGDIAALAGGPANPGEYATEVNRVYEDIASGAYPSGFQAAYGGSVNTGVGPVGPSGPQGAPSSSNSSSSTSTTGDPPAQQSGGHGFLHTMQNTLNYGPIDVHWYEYFYGKGEIDTVFNIVLVVAARAAVIIVGAGFILAGAVPIVLDLGKVYLGSNRLLQPLERLQRLALTPQRVTQAERRLTIAENQAVNPPSRQATFGASAQRRYLDWQRENRIRASRGEPTIPIPDDLLDAVFPQGA